MGQPESLLVLVEVLFLLGCFDSVLAVHDLNGDELVWLGGVGNALMELTSLEWELFDIVALVTATDIIDDTASFGCWWLIFELFYLASLEQLRLFFVLGHHV